MRRVGLCGIAFMLGVGLAGCDSTARNTTGGGVDKPPVPTPSSTTAAVDESSTHVVLNVPGMH